MIQQTKIGGIILAAGIGKRLGMGPKAFVPFAGQTLLERALETLRRNLVSEIVVVLPPETPFPADLRCTVNREPESGPLGSVLAGINHLPQTVTHVVIYPVDHALVTHSSVAAICDTARQHQIPKSISYVSPTWRGTPGHPILLTPLTIEILRRETFQKTEILRNVLHAIAPPHPLPVNSEGILHNINSPEDYQFALNQLR